MSPALSINLISDTCLVIGIEGDWVIGQKLPDLSPILQKLENSNISSLQFDCHALGRWDSILLSCLTNILKKCKNCDVAVDTQDLPRGLQGMLQLMKMSPDRIVLEHEVVQGDLLYQIGKETRNLINDLSSIVDFVGEVFLSFLSFLMGRVEFRRADLVSLIRGCGPNALPIVSLISLLVGMILAFIGAVQLRVFGAQVFIADLVGLGMAREMGAMMTAILLAGRTGAAFAAELGSMQVNDELDAFKTSGFNLVNFLVLPRILALLIVSPFLCIYADALGILGGAIVSSSMFEISLPEYFIQVKNRLNLSDIEIGVVKSAVFGILVAMAGCLRGLQCGRNSSSVGRVTTSAVVTGIIFIVFADAVLNLLVTTLNLIPKT